MDRAKGIIEALAFVVAAMAMVFCVGVAAFAFVAGEVFSFVQGGVAIAMFFFLGAGLGFAIHRRRNSGGEGS